MTKKKSAKIVKLNPGIGHEIIFNYLINKITEEVRENVSNQFNRGTKRRVDVLSSTVLKLKAGYCIEMTEAVFTDTFLVGSNNNPKRVAYIKNLMRKARITAPAIVFKNGNVFIWSNA